jgi:hypothetical protein
MQTIVPLFSDIYYCRCARWLHIEILRCVGSHWQDKKLSNQYDELQSC